MARRGFIRSSCSFCMAGWRYVKGAHYERELSKRLVEKGFRVVRSAGSGVDGVSPDLTVLSSVRKFALECKAWKNSVYIDKAKFVLMQEWERDTGLPIYLAWKHYRDSWKFFPLSALKETEKNFVASEGDLVVGLSFDELVAHR